MKIDWLVKKDDNWIIATLIKEDGTKINDVSINRANKKGEVFPNFDEIRPGNSIDGTLWQSPSGKWYLFAPKEQSNRKPNMDRIMDKKANLISEAQGEKAKHIAEAQDRSAWMWAKTNATTLIGDSMKDSDNDTITDRILDLATKIYNGEPLSPFNG